jgi:molybdate transport system substrate-binding protein
VAQVNVLISGGFSGAYEELLPEFERTSGIKVVTGSGASQGTGPQTIAAQLARGVPSDVVILSREGLAELIAAKRIVAGTDVDLARVPVGVAVRAGAPKPDVSTVEAFKQVLLKAQTVAVPGSTSGYLAYDRSFSAARHHGKDQRRSHAPRHGRGRDGRRRRRESCSLADQ